MATHGRPAEEPLFELGRTVITRTAKAVLDEQDVLQALHRHHRGDWGDIDEGDREENELALRRGFRLLSAYSASDGTRFWVITEADRSVTTVLLPEDY